MSPDKSANFSERYFIPPLYMEISFSLEHEGLAGHHKAQCRSGSGTQLRWVEGVTAISEKCLQQVESIVPSLERAYVRQAWKWDGMVLVGGGCGEGRGGRGEGG